MGKILSPTLAWICFFRLSLKMPLVGDKTFASPQDFTLKFFIKYMVQFTIFMIISFITFKIKLTCQIKIELLLIL